MTIREAEEGCRQRRMNSTAALGFLPAMADELMLSLTEANDGASLRIEIAGWRPGTPERQAMRLSFLKQPGHVLLLLRAMHVTIPGAL